MTVMISQSDIARALKLNQSTVSRALKGDVRIPERLRKRVKTAAARMGYAENPFVKALMSQVRAKRKISERGVIAFVVESFTRTKWKSFPPLTRYHEGASRRAGELGYRLEPFFLKEDCLSVPMLESILLARGIRGLMFAHTWQGEASELGKLRHCACVTTGWNIEQQEFDLVANDYSCNMIIAYEQLARLGYSRVGVALNPYTMHLRAIRWIPGFLECQEYLPRNRRIPYFVRNLSPKESPERFHRWLKRWQPDVLLTADLHLHQWLELVSIKAPDDIGLAALGSLPGPDWSGIEEDESALGARVVEQVTTKLERGEFGPSLQPTVTLIPGHWAAGKTLRRIGPPLTPPIAWTQISRLAP